MRFQRTGRYAFTDTPRKRAALARKYRLEREASPLFADQIASEQTAPDEVMAGRADRAARHERENRARNARTWRKARAKLASYAPADRAALRAHWQRCGYPGTGSYLLTLLHMFDTGTLQSIVPNWPPA